MMPLIAAILLTALLQPLAARLRGFGMPGLLATWLTFLAAIVIIASHDHELLRRTCTSIVNLDHGRIVNTVSLEAPSPYPFELREKRA